MQDTDALRKAAVLVASLDRDTADSVLDQLPDEQASLIRQTMMGGIDAVSEVETRTTISDFLYLEEAPPEEDLYPDSIDDRTISETPTAPTEIESKPILDEQLHSTPDTTLVDLLQNEQSQTIAVVLGRVSAERASEIVTKLPIPKQADVLQRIVEGDRLAVRLDDTIAHEFESWLIERLESARQRSQLVSRLSKIVGAAPAETQQRILANLATSDISLSRDLGYAGSGHRNPPSDSLTVDTESA